MFRYINMPKLVAFYLREFSIRSDGTPSNLYKFIFCLCLPFVSQTFRIARLNALAVAECTNSEKQIIRVLEKITGAVLTITPYDDTYMASWNGAGMAADFSYQGGTTTLVAYEATINAGQFTIQLNGASANEVEAYLELLIPFYIDKTIVYV